MYPAASLGTVNGTAINVNLNGILYAGTGSESDGQRHLLERPCCCHSTNITLNNSSAHMGSIIASVRSYRWYHNGNPNGVLLSFRPRAPGLKS